MMYVLVCYDVNTQDAAGRKRLRHIAKTCERYGQRVQNSVFEIWCDHGQFLEVKHKLISEMDQREDSIRLYHLHKDYQGRVEHYGKKETYDPASDVLIF